MRFIRATVCLAAFMSVASLPQALSAAVLCVNPAGGGCSTTIQAAVDTAGAGDTIDIAAATYVENVLIPATKDNLTLSGSGAIIDGTGISGTAITVLADGVTIEGLAIQNIEGRGIWVGDAGEIPSGTTIRDVRISGTGDSCIYLDGADGTNIVDTRLDSCGNQSIEGEIGPDSNGSDGTIVDSAVMIFGDNGCVEITGDATQVIGSRFDFCEDEECVDVRGDDASVEGNKMTGCDDGGVYVVGANALVQKNKIRNIDAYGIKVEGENPSVLKNSLSYSGAGIGVFSNPCNGGSVVGNKVADATSSDGDGVDVECTGGSGGLRVEKNKVSRMLENCFEIRGAAVQLIGNAASGCGGAGGFTIAADNSTIDGNSVKASGQHGFRVRGSNNVLTGNKASGSFGSGFVVENDASGNTLTANKSSGSVAPGFAVYGAGTTVTLAGNSAGDTVPFCEDSANPTVVDGLGNSFSLAAPPVCPFNP